MHSVYLQTSAIICYCAAIAMETRR